MAKKKKKDEMEVVGRILSLFRSIDPNRQVFVKDADAYRVEIGSSVSKGQLDGCLANKTTNPDLELLRFIIQFLKNYCEKNELPFNFEKINYDWIIDGVLPTATTSIKEIQVKLEAAQKDNSILEFENAELRKKLRELQK